MVHSNRFLSNAKMMNAKKIRLLVVVWYGMSIVTHPIFTAVALVRSVSVVVPIAVGVVRV